MLSGAACQGDLFSSTPVVATIENSPIPLVVALTHAPAPTATESIHPPVVEVENPTATPSKPPTPTPTATSSPIPTITPTSPALYGSSEKEHYWFARPIAQFEMNWTDKYYPYGSTRNGTLRPHHGVEFIVPMKTAVLAVADGVVVVAGDDSAETHGAQTNFYGNLVVIKHDFEYENRPIFTLYAHLSAIKVKVGDRVQFRQEIALSGNSGLAQGPHLHFEVRIDKNHYKNTLNPLLWIAPFDGFGTLAGKITLPDGTEAHEATITLQRLDGRSPYKGTTTYAEGDTNNDPLWQENFALDDVRPGHYLVNVEYLGRRYKIETEIKENATTFVTLELKTKSK